MSRVVQCRKPALVKHWRREGELGDFHDLHPPNFSLVHWLTSVTTESAGEGYIKNSSNILGSFCRTAPEPHGRRAARVTVEVHFRHFRWGRLQ